MLGAFWFPFFFLSAVNLFFQIYPECSGTACFVQHYSKMKWTSSKDPWFWWPRDKVYSVLMQLVWVESYLLSTQWWMKSSAVTDICEDYLRGSTQILQKEREAVFRIIICVQGRGRKNMVMSIVLPRKNSVQKTIVCWSRQCSLEKSVAMLFLLQNM